MPATEDRKITESKDLEIKVRGFISYSSCIQRATSFMLSFATGIV